MEASDLKAIAVIRKPLEGTVAANTLKHGCGGLNIDASRITTGDALGGGAATQTTATQKGNEGWVRPWMSDPSAQQAHATRVRDNIAKAEALGRWPANLILSHLSECQQDGMKKVKGTPGGEHSGRKETHKQVGGFGHDRHGVQRHNDEDGNETVANWICAEGCPVRALDEQSGVCPSTGDHPSTAKNTSIYRPGQPPMAQGRLYADTGGASRFFKNIQGDLVSYLRDLIAPPYGVVEVVPLDMVDPTGKDASIHGAIVLGAPTEDQCVELLRICKPGAHVLLIAPEEQPTGHTGMCRMEDAGFEIRDSILLILGAGGFWYVPKPSRAERNAGCHNLGKKKQDMSRKEGNPGGDNPRNRGLKERGNHHPTVKPSALMAKLIKGSDQPVLDPFMGSGSTGIGAILTGLDGLNFIGIERDAEYMAVADARIRHWADSEWRGHIVEVSSDHEAEGHVDELNMADLFGFGGGE
jgi:hypothetical protein